MKSLSTFRIYLITGIAGFIMPYFTGFLGLMPLDQSILFEAGGRISRDEIPFHDFSLPYGLVPALVQALFFKALGINWFAYITQAAVFNGLFALVVFNCLKFFLPQSSSTKLIFVSLLAAWAYYPMTGTPFMENHSLFFSLTAWLACFVALEKRKYVLLLLVFPLLVPGFYSKPLPVVFWIFPILLEYWFHRKEWMQWIVWTIYGTMIAAALLALPLLLFPPETFFYYSFVLPLHLGQKRMGGVAAGSIVEKLNQCKLLVLCLAPLFFLIKYRLKAVISDKKIFYRIILMISITITAGFLSLNDFYNATTPVFIISFFVFDTMFYPDKKEAGYYRYARPVLWTGLIAGISYLNFTRKVNDMTFGFRDFSHYSPDLGIYLKLPPGAYQYSTGDIHRLKKYISRGHALYIGDLMLLYSMTNQKNPWPITHIHDGTSYNSRDTMHYNSLKRKLLQNIVDLKVNLLISDSMWWPNENFVSFAEQFKGRKKDSFGAIRIYEIDTLKIYQAAKNLNMNLEK